MSEQFNNRDYIKVVYNLREYADRKTKDFVLVNNNDYAIKLLHTDLLSYYIN